MMQEHYITLPLCLSCIFVDHQLQADVKQSQNCMMKKTMV